MKIAPHIIQLIRDRAKLSEIVSKKIKLSRAGHEYKALCPFHSEKSPSFYVNDQKKFYHCFGCHEHGDVFKFLMKTDGYDYLGAVKYLAEQMGITLQEMNEEEKKKYDKEKQFLEIMLLTQKFFEREFRSNNHLLQKVIRERGLTPEIISKFAIGYAPKDRISLKEYLTKLKFNENILKEAGLLVERDGLLVDKFANRLMFPIKNIRGEVVAFGGRALGKVKPKYLNSPETIIFSKKQTLYNYYQAKNFARNSNQIIVVEGYFDVIAMTRADFANVVAPMGTAFTEDQIKTIFHDGYEIVLCFDGDQAGRAATEKTLKECLKFISPEHRISAILLPEGQDPDDCLNQGNVSELKEMVANPQTLSTVLWQIITKDLELNSPESRLILKKSCDDLIDSITNLEVKKIYREYFKQKLYEFGRSKKIAPTILHAKPQLKSISHSAILNSEISLAILVDMLKSEDNLLLEKFAEIEFHTHEAQILQKNIIESDNEIIPPTEFAHIKAMIKERIKSSHDHSKLFLYHYNSYMISAMKQEHLAVMRSFDQEAMSKAKVYQDEINKLNMVNKQLIEEMLDG